MTTKRLTLALLLTAGSLQAQEESAPFSLGFSLLDVDLSPSEFNSPGFDVDDDGYKINLAYRLSTHFSLEAGYYDLGDIRFNSSTVNNVPVSLQHENSGVALSLLADKHYGEWFVQGKLGVLNSETDSRVNGLPGLSLDTSSTDLLLGLGVGYDLSDHFALKLEYERANGLGAFDDADIYSLGLNYRF